MEQTKENKLKKYEATQCFLHCSVFQHTFFIIKIHDIARIFFNAARKFSFSVLSTS
jgi:hypothetical protein